MTVLSRKKAWPIADPIGLWGSLCQAELDLVATSIPGDDLDLGCPGVLWPGPIP